MKSAAISLLALGLCEVAGAEPYRGVAFAGGTVSDDDSAYSGVIVALPGAVLGHGLAVKIAANGGRYDYLGGPGDVRAKYYGGQLGLVRQWSGAWGWANLSAGARATQTDLSPNDPGNKRAGLRLDVSLETDGAILLDERWRLGWYSEGGVRDESYLARLEATRAIGAGPWRLGAEGVIQGDPTYQIRKVGGVIGVEVRKGLDLRLVGGAAFQDQQRTRPYVSIGFSKLF